MKLSYEKACIEAGLTEEEIQEIRKMFDADYKRLNRRNGAIERNSIQYFSIEDVSEDGDYSFDITDDSMNPERCFIEKYQLERLSELMNNISEQGQELLMMYCDKRVHFYEYAASIRMKRGEAIEMAEKLLIYLRTYMY